jgi:hypothetical protein
MPFLPWAQQNQRVQADPYEGLSWWDRPIITGESPSWQKALYGMTPWSANTYASQYATPSEMLGSPEFQLASLGLGGGGGGASMAMMPFIQGVPKFVPPAAGAARAAATAAPTAAAAAAPAAEAVSPAIAKTVPSWLGKIGNVLGQINKKTPGLVKLGVPAGGAYAWWANTQEDNTGGGMPWDMLPIPSTVPGTTTPTETPNLPNIGGGEMGGNPKIVEVSGYKFWYDPGTGQWTMIPAAKANEPAEDQSAYYQMQLQIARENAASQLAQIQLQNDLARQREGKSAAEEMAQMYAAEPYKYWAQMGQLTPEAVARLTGGAVQAGQPFKGTPLSYPSMQWWQNLLPSEQTQILGALNWMGINPEDWTAMQARMIPGLGSRQIEPVWSR